MLFGESYKNSFQLRWLLAKIPVFIIPGFWFLDAQPKYTWFRREPGLFEQFEHQCGYQMGRLASIQSEEDQEWVRKYISRKFTMVLTGMFQNPQNTSEFIDSDGRPLRYT